MRFRERLFPLSWNAIAIFLLAIARHPASARDVALGFDQLGPASVLG